MIIRQFCPVIQSITVFIVSLGYILFAPYTKVEESFSLQAIHDFLYLSTPNDLQNKLSKLLQNNVQNGSLAWDHENFPGVVHRTFIGPFLVFILAKPVHLLNLFQNKFLYQIIARACLSACFSFSYYTFIDAITKYKGLLSGQLITLLTIGQFHTLFYSSRTLPNTFSLIFVLLVYSSWFQKNWNRFLILVAFTVLVMRFETIILFGCIILYEVFYNKNLTLTTVLKTGIPSGIVCLATSVGFDSVFWGKWIWPEGDGILFNIVENKSSQWGTQPFYWYFVSVIPRLSMSSLFFLFLMPKSILNKFVLIPLTYVLFYSILPHKELRFIIYVAPMLNYGISQAIIQLSNLRNQLENSKKSESASPSSEKLNESIYKNLRSRKVKKAGEVSKKAKQEPLPKTSSFEKVTKFFLKWFFPLVLYSHFVLNLCLSALLLYISFNNYPGGEAVHFVNRDIQRNTLINSPSSISVYVNNLAAQTGFTRFLELEQIYYNKKPKFSVEQFVNYQTLYLILEPNETENYLNCTVNSSNVKECKIFAPNQKSFVCKSQKSISAFERIDLKQMSIRFQQVLTVFKCTKQFRL